MFLPPYSPELQPAERLWPLLRESAANRPLETLVELEQILVERCRWLADDRDTVKSHTRYAWWPNDAAPS